MAQGHGIFEAIWQAPPDSISHVASVDTAGSCGKKAYIDLQLPLGAYWSDGSSGRGQLPVSTLPAVKTACDSLGECRSVLFIHDTPPSPSCFLAYTPDISQWFPAGGIASFIQSNGLTVIEAWAFSLLAKQPAQWEEQPEIDGDLPLQATLQQGGKQREHITLLPLVAVSSSGNEIIPDNKGSIVKLLVPRKRPAFKFSLRRHIFAPRKYLENRLLIRSR